MNLRSRLFSAIAAAIVSTMLISCGEMAVRVKGRLVDAAGAPRKNCLVTVVYRNQTIGEYRVAGAFDETVVFRPSTGDPLTVNASCYGTRSSFEQEIARMPKKIDSTVDFGDVVLP